MSIIPPTDPILSRIGTTSSGGIFTPHKITLQLPAISQIYGGAGQPLAGLAKAAYSQLASEIWQQASQTALGSIAVNVGMPVIEMFQTTLDVLEIDVITEMQASLVEAYGTITDAQQAMIKASGDAGGQAMELTVESGAGPAVDFAAAVPIVGAVAKMLWSIGKLLFKIRKIQNQDDAKIIYPDLVFNPQWDNEVLNRLIRDRIALTRNWDSVFSPPSVGIGAYGKRFGITHTTTSELVRRYDLLEYGEALWVGMVPGTGTLHQGLEIKNALQMQDIGSTYLPSARTLLTWLWQNVIGHGNIFTPTMYCVNTKGDPHWWQQYIFDLHRFIYETDDLSEDVKKKVIVNWNRDSDGKKVFGWGTAIKPNDDEVENYQPIKELKKLRDRQMGFLDTLMVAYVDESYTAIKNDGELNARWDQRRKQLLEHPARCEVQLSSVPDAAYREALIARGVGKGICMTGGLGLAATNTDNPFWPPGKLPEGQVPGSEPQRVAGPQRKGDRKIPVWVPIAGVAAISAGAYYGYKKGLHQDALKLAKGWREKLPW